MKDKTNINNYSIKYLELLADQYRNINAACTEIINLQAILNLPKGTEHFVSDIHGEFEAFNHVLKNASGVIKEYVNEIFGTSIRETEKRNLTAIIYYPELKLQEVMSTEDDICDWYRITLFRLVRICKRVCSKYTRSKVRKALPKDFSYILEELIHEDSDRIHKHEYYNEIIDTMIRLNRAPAFIIAISSVIHRLAIDHLHVIGDIFDRGPAADKIMDLLLNYHSVDVQWGNHDICWMGAASGGISCISNVIRVSAKYNNLHIIEEGYGINLIPLATFAMEYYKDDPCTKFRPDTILNGQTEKEIELIAKMHKAICIIQFKSEAQVIKRNPEYNMDDRLLFNKINFENQTITLNEKVYPLIDFNVDTIDPKNPYEFTAEEIDVVSKIKNSFVNCPKLQEHTRFLFNKGGMYKIYNGNLLFHGSIPLNEDGTFKKVSINGKKLCGKELFDEIEIKVRQGYFSRTNKEEKNEGLDLIWYLWCGADSPLYGKGKMTTFERYFIDDEDAREEEKTHYYSFRDSEEICIKVLEEFGLCATQSKIINGHVPVKVKKGESPVKAGGKLIVIDGGFARAYQKVTGIAGYTLIYNSKGLILTSHEPFTSLKEVIKNEKDVLCSSSYIERKERIAKVEDTDIGRELEERIEDLEALVEAYSKGIIKEKI